MTFEQHDGKISAPMQFLQYEFSSRTREKQQNPATLSEEIQAHIIVRLVLRWKKSPLAIIPHSQIAAAAKLTLFLLLFLFRRTRVRSGTACSCTTRWRGRSSSSSTRSDVQ
jgi:hypothetical protein